MTNSIQILKNLSAQQYTILPEDTAAMLMDQDLNISYPTLDRLALVSAGREVKVIIDSYIAAVEDDAVEIDADYALNSLHKQASNYVLNKAMSASSKSSSASSNLMDDAMVQAMADVASELNLAVK